jgi:hypothetical protein
MCVCVCVCVCVCGSLVNAVQFLTLLQRTVARDSVVGASEMRLFVGREVEMARTYVGCWCGR